MVRKKLKGAEQYKHAGANEKEIVEEKMKDVIKYFNDDEYYYSNQQIIGCKDMFRGAIMKEWIISNEHCVNFHICGKILIKCCVQFYVECWKRRHVRLHSPGV